MLYTIRLSSTRSENVCVYVCSTHNLSAPVSQRWLNRFEQTWAHLKAIVVLLIKFKRIMGETSGSGDITGNVIFRPALLELPFFSRRWLNRFGQPWTRLKAIVCP